MTLNDIIISALVQLDRGHDDATVEAYRNRLTRYANDAQDDLAQCLGLTKTEIVPAPGGVLDLNVLQRPCLRIEKIIQRGGSVPFRTGEQPDHILLPYATVAMVTYRYQLKPLVNATDVSELREHLHPLIVTYVVGRERMGGDTATQDGGSIYLSMYNAAKAKLRGYLKDSDSFKIVNRY